MQPTHDVLLDLLALVRAEEASDDSKALVELHMERDEKFAQIARESLATPLDAEIPEPTLEEMEMETFEKAQKALYVKAFLIAGGALTLLTLLAFVLAFVALTMLH